jgi:hypothetical protein
MPAVWEFVAIFVGALAALVPSRRLAVALAVTGAVVVCAAAGELVREPALVLWDITQALSGLIACRLVRSRLGPAGS